jgi:outer membrane protein W
MKCSLFILFSAAMVVAPAQVVTFGVKAGVPLTSAPFNSGTTHTDRWTVGATVEGHITKSFSIEVDALYRGYNRFGEGIFYYLPGTGMFPIASSDTSYTYRYEVKAWDAPILLKYRFAKGPIRPFINGGLQYTHESADVTISCFGPACNSLSSVILPKYIGQSTVQSNRWGVVGGAGVEFRLGKMRIAPEYRYTRLNNPGGNQSTLLVGFTF